ncbi:MAG: phosphomethylpyrimidine synthase ThiC [Candidatus Omnitrophica bacterium]|nr:phosphomethylpyrimidine synthase ThiC [Candidatus Omnitrophota bacterium]
MRTLIESARANKIPQIIRDLAKKEEIPQKLLAKLVSAGRVVIPLNIKKQISKPCAIGEKMRVKINANIGTSPDNVSLRNELKKLKIAEKFGTDTIMDLSIGGDISKIRKQILNHSNVPLGTVPVYEAAVKAIKKNGDFIKMRKDDILEVISSQAKDGVDFFTIHCGVTRKTLETVKKHPRLMGIVSRGGAILARWIKKNNQENPFFEYFDDILKIVKQYDVTLSLGDGLRPGSILDATDKAQIDELKLLGFLAKKALHEGVQVMIEGPGHIPLNQIQKNIELQKRYCNGAPFYVLGPLVTDIGVGYDHISAAIGSAVAAAYGADFLCFVTPAEHIKLPNENEIKLGVIASRIAAHSGDLARGNAAAFAQDRLMSLARKQRNWNKQIKMSFDPQKTKLQRLECKTKTNDVCSMCGEFCSIKLMEQTD